MSETTMTTKSEEKILSTDDIFAAEDVTYTTVPAWGGLVRFGSLDAGSMLEFVEANEGPAKRTAGIRLIIRSLVDKSGIRIGKIEMMDAFKKKNAKVLNFLVAEILKLNGIGESKQKDRVDITNVLTLAGKDPVKLKALVEELRGLATSVEEAGTDDAKLAALLDRDREEAKNV